jgi:hypothetical protein
MHLFELLALVLNALLLHYIIIWRVLCLNKLIDVLFGKRENATCVDGIGKTYAFL